jgi:hypothetical protein
VETTPPLLSFEVFFLCKNVCRAGYNQGGKFDDIVNKVLNNMTAK